MRYLILLALLLCLPVRGEAWQVVGASGASGPFLYDSLYEESPVSLSSHAADIGGVGWVVVGTIVVSTNGLAGAAGQSLVYHTNVTPPTANYTVRVKGTLGAYVNWDRRFGPAVRVTTSKDGYVALLERTGTFSIKKIVAGQESISFPAASVSVDGTTEYTVELTVSGATLTARLFNGTTQIGRTLTETDSTYETAGFAGIYIGRAEPRITDFEAMP